MMALSTHNTRRFVAGTCSVLALFCLGLSQHVHAAPAQPTVITLTQTGCQFVAVETQDHGFATTTAADCEAIHDRTTAARLAAAKTLTLKPGTYVFRVTHENVPCELGFYLRESGFGRLTLPKVSGGGLLTGISKDYVIDLTEGEYMYSCPPHPTPNYRLVVQQ
jgi:hypothetical protein